MIATCLTYELKRFWRFQCVFKNFGGELLGSPLLVAGLLNSTRFNISELLMWLRYIVLMLTTSDIAASQRYVVGDMIKAGP